ncbi:MAG: hypothetical protein M3680_01770 [Myxococcota bacterium]|nr:hypothetical protein [Myxococcota bacterium]
MARRNLGLLRANDALEDAVAEDPYDEDRWSILEDWLLQEETDPRAAIILLEQVGKVEEAARARDALLGALLGTRHEALTETLFALRWRAGYLRECHFAELNGVNPTKLFEALATARAASLLRALVLSVHHKSVPAISVRLAAARFTRSLRRLTLAGWGEVPLIEAQFLAPLRRLRDLELRGMYVQCTPEHELASVRSLTLSVTPYDHRELPRVLAATRFASVDELVFDVGSLAGAPADLQHVLAPRVLEPLLDGTVVAQTRRLEIRGASLRRAVHPLLEILAKSPLLATLTELSLGEAPAAAAALRRRFNAAYDGLTTLTLPAGFKP